MPLVDQYGAPIQSPRAARATRWQRPRAPSAAVGAWTYADAVAAVESVAFAELTPDEYVANHAIAELHDHWRDGKGWVGPNAGGEGEVWRLLKADIARQFTPVDVVDETLTRFANALLKREPSVDFVPLQPSGENGAPSEAEVEEALEVRRAIAAWWDRVKLWRLARRVTKRSRWASRGTMRAFIDASQRERNADGTTSLPTGLTLDEALARVQVDAPDPTHAAIVRDPETGAAVAVLLYPRETERGVVNVAQTWRRGTGADDGRLLVREVLESGPAEDYTVSIDRIPFAEMTAELLLKDAERRQQARLNFSESSVVRAAETSAFRERYFLNAEPFGIWVDGAPEPGENVAKVEYGPHGVVVRRLLRVPPTLGSHVLTELQGIQLGGANGAIAEPEVVIADAADPENVLKTSRHSRGTMLQSMRQGHVLRPTDQQTSGYSQEQARADHEDDATNVRPELEAMVRDILEAVLAWALPMLKDGTPVGRDFLRRFRCVVTLHVSTGPLTKEQQDAVIALYEKKLISRATALARLGFEDVDAEIALLEGSETAKLERLTAYATAMTSLADIPGGSVEMAARVMVAMGFDATLVKAIVPSDTDGRPASAAA